MTYQEVLAELFGPAWFLYPADTSPTQLVRQTQAGDLDAAATVKSLGGDFPILIVFSENLLPPFHAVDETALRDGFDHLRTLEAFRLRFQL